MTDENNKTVPVPNSPVIIHKQYLKDMSFENPNAPDILTAGNKAPEMDMNIGMDVKRLEHDEHENYYEVSLTLNASAAREGKAMFIAEIIYAATLSIEGVEEGKHHPILLIEIPHLLFPFARQVLAGITQSGGFNALTLRPVDFRSMYLQRFGQENDKENDRENAQDNSAENPDKTVN